MKFFQFFSFFLLLLLIKISSPVSNNSTNNIKQEQPKKILSSNQQNIPSQNQSNQNENNININNTSTNASPKNESKKNEKPFNLTEALINFFQETFGSKDNNTKNDSNKNMNNKVEDENERKKREAEAAKKLKEEPENKAKLERIEMEAAKNREKLKKYEEDRENFLKILANNSFEEIVQINLEKGERETLYLDLQSLSKIKFAVMLSDSDQEEKINLFFSGPNARGHTMVINQYYHKNYLFYEYETKRAGEYYVEITNKGTKDNEVYFLFNDNMYKDPKKDVLDTEKIDKISMLLNNIDNNINQLRNKKKIEIKQVNSHNDKVTNNNKWIVIYSLIEIFTMILVFLIQSCYINSLVNKV